jgi:hypothetical protein
MQPRRTLDTLIAFHDDRLRATYDRLNEIKNSHLARIRHSWSTGEPHSLRFRREFGDFSLFALWAVDLACRWFSARRLLRLGVLPINR